MADEGVKLKVTIFADGRTAVRAIKDVATQSDKTAKQVQGDAKKQKRSFEEVEGGTHKLRGAVGTLMGTAGLGGLAFGLADVVKAGQDWQTQQARLQQSLRSTGLYSKQLMDSINTNTEFTATRGGFAAPEQLQAMSQFIRLTGNATRAFNANQAAMELARGTGMDYSKTQMMIGQALTGNTGRLQKYLGIIQPVKTAEFALTQAHGLNLIQLENQSKALGKLGPSWLRLQELHHAITPEMLQHAQLLDRQATATMMLSRIQQRYGGSMKAYSNTTAGAISNARNAIDLAMEKIGAAMLPIVAKIAQGIAKLADYLESHKHVLVEFGVALGAIGAAFAFTKIVEGVRALSGAMIAFSGAEEGATLGAIAFGTAMRLTIIGLVVTALVLLVTHFNTVKRVATDVWNWIKHGASDAGHWISGAFGGVMHSFNDVWKFIEGAANWIWRKLKWLGTEVGKIWKSTPLGGLTGAIGAIGGGHFGKAAGDLLHGATFGLLHSGGEVQPKYMAWGGPVGSDTVPGWLSPGEYVLRREAVQNIGITNLNSINAGGGMAGGASSPDTIYVTMPIQLKLPNGRILSEQTVHAVAKRSALAGSYVSG